MSKWAINESCGVQFFGVSIRISFNHFLFTVQALVWGEKHVGVRRHLTIVIGS